ncbi:nucleoside diphosphate kinase regulator [Manganibacter manganicus]|uniref:Nucleoside diphosphate kinase regulator n=1 Tax=Manganibacter manganicus TaxID=1873176 RepID=A0A1V8RTN5_9HYPH|nr:nucleoside diphosphate kinase regulator [Pseudaminobacter manganicus]OQM76561.1 nucleoside diphosphate kinase regulator [Pseudaminobacter manganicus]
MQSNIKARRKPNIRIMRTDHARLSALAEATAARNPDISDELFAELDRARVINDADAPADLIRMGSVVTYKPDSSEARTVTLVFPVDADIEQNRISILTPIGTALIGLSAGQAINWIARDGRRHELSVVAVTQSQTEDRPQPISAHA